MRYRLSVLALAVGAAAAVAPAAGSATSASIVIRHELRGCHTWSLNGGAYVPELQLRLGRGGRLTITNNDPMVHRLVKERGPAVGMRTIAHRHMRMVGRHDITGRGVMSHMGAMLRVTFPRAGTYVFTTEDLGDYFELKSVGMHNHLHLTVRVG